MHSSCVRVQRAGKFVHVFVPRRGETGGTPALPRAYAIGSLLPNVLEAGIIFDRLENITLHNTARMTTVESFQPKRPSFGVPRRVNAGAKTCFDGVELRNSM